MHLTDQCSVSRRTFKVSLPQRKGGFAQFEQRLSRIKSSVQWKKMLWKRKRSTSVISHTRFETQLHTHTLKNRAHTDRRRTQLPVALPKNFHQSPLTSITTSTSFKFTTTLPHSRFSNLHQSDALVTTLFAKLTLQKLLFSHLDTYSSATLNTIFLNSSFKSAMRHSFRLFPHR